MLNEPEITLFWTYFYFWCQILGYWKSEFLSCWSLLNLQKKYMWDYWCLLLRRKMWEAGNISNLCLLSLISLLPKTLAIKKNRSNVCNAARCRRDANESLRGKVRCCFGEIHFLHPSSTCPSCTHTLICTRTQTNTFVCPTQLKATARFAHAVLHTALCGLLHWVSVQWEPCLTAVKTTCLLCADINILILFCWAEADHTTTGCPGFAICWKTIFFSAPAQQVMYLKVFFKPHPQERQITH